MKGADKHFARMKKLTSPAVIKAANRVVFVGADMIKAKAQVSITTGSISGAGHIASKPGEAPNADTRVLDKNIESALIKPLVAQVSSNADYSAALEFGTSKMAARPFMRPARDKMKSRIEKLFAEEMNKLVRSSNA